jgi:hypothetical protein
MSCQAIHPYHRAWLGQAKWAVPCPPDGLPAKSKHDRLMLSAGPGLLPIVSDCARAGPNGAGQIFRTNWGLAPLCGGKEANFFVMPPIGSAKRYVLLPTTTPMHASRLELARDDCLLQRRKIGAAVAERMHYYCALCSLHVLYIAQILPCSTREGLQHWLMWFEGQYYFLELLIVWYTFHRYMYVWWRSCLLYFNISTPRMTLDRLCVHEISWMTLACFSQ